MCSWQDDIVTMVMMLNSRKILLLQCCCVAALRWFVPQITVAYFCIFLINPNIRSETWLYIRKANEASIPTIHCPYGNNVKFSRTCLILLFKKYAIQTGGVKTQETALSPWGMLIPSNTKQNSSDNLPSYLQTNIIAQMLSVCEHSYLEANISKMVWDRRLVPITH